MDRLGYHEGTGWQRAVRCTGIAWPAPPSWPSGVCRGGSCADIGSNGASEQRTATDGSSQLQHGRSPSCDRWTLATAAGTRVSWYGGS